MAFLLPVLLDSNSIRKVFRHEVRETGVGGEGLQLVKWIEILHQQATKVVVTAAIVLHIHHQRLDARLLHLGKHTVKER